MILEYSSMQENFYVTGSERRHAKQPRRSGRTRRHRIRFESTLSDCRTRYIRRQEEKEGFIEFESLYEKQPSSCPD